LSIPEQSDVAQPGVAASGTRLTWSTQGGAHPKPFAETVEDVAQPGVAASGTRLTWSTQGGAHPKPFAETVEDRYSVVGGSSVVDSSVIGVWSEHVPVPGVEDGLAEAEPAEGRGELTADDLALLQDLAGVGASASREREGIGASL
jgi:hypothetical protein